MAKNQTEKNLLKKEVTGNVRNLVEQSGVATSDTVKGFVFESDGYMIEVSCVVKKETFDPTYAQEEYDEKVANAKELAQTRAEKKAKDIAKKNKA